MKATFRQNWRRADDGLFASEREGLTSMFGESFIFRIQNVPLLARQAVFSGERAALLDKPAVAHGRFSLPKI
ncbi:MAG: hypothetical protein NXI22_14850 [bacterium]|nr:hypothetical protein [bacterium]